MRRLLAAVRRALDRQPTGPAVISAHHTPSRSRIPGAKAHPFARRPVVPAGRQPARRNSMHKVRKTARGDWLIDKTPEIGQPTCDDFQMPVMVLPLIEGQRYTVGPP